MRIAWSDARSRFPNIEKGEILERTMLGMEVEALTALDDWISVARLVEVSLRLFEEIRFDAGIVRLLSLHRISLDQKENYQYPF